MANAKHDLVRSWLIKARHDLASARKLAAGDEPLLDTAVYHCQQAGEKAVKGFLVFHDQRFKKTHDIRALRTLAEQYESGFSPWQQAAEKLTPYAAVFRYPAEFEEPTQEEFDQALQAAEGLFDYVCSVLPQDVAGDV